MTVGGACRVVSLRDMVSQQRPLSAFFLDIEADMVSRLAREAHLRGERFVYWPVFEVQQDDNIYARMLTYAAKVEAE